MRHRPQRAAAPSTTKRPHRLVRPDRMFAVLINFVMFQVVEQSGPAVANGPGVSFPSAAALLGAGRHRRWPGRRRLLLRRRHARLLGTGGGSDYSTGLVRIIVAAEPRRWRLLLGKWVALAVVTALTCLAALVVNLMSHRSPQRQAGSPPMPGEPTSPMCCSAPSCTSTSRCSSGARSASPSPRSPFRGCRHRRRRRIRPPVRGRHLRRRERHQRLVPRLDPHHTRPGRATSPSPS